MMPRMSLPPLLTALAGAAAVAVAGAIAPAPLGAQDTAAAAGAVRGDTLPRVSQEALRHAVDLLEREPIVDGHNDLAWEIRHFDAAPMSVEAYDLRVTTPGHTDLARLEQGGVGGQFWSVYVPGEIADSGYARVQLEQIDIIRRVIERYPELELALTADDVERIMEEGRIASLIGMEGGHVLENSLGTLRAYYLLGARYMTLTHNVTLAWADAAMDVHLHGGLTEFGEEVVREMNRLGMIVDLSHTSPETMEDALRVTRAPVMFSHSSARALTDHPRNVPDDILERLPENGGVVMVTFVPGFISTEVMEWEEARDAEEERLESIGFIGEGLEEAVEAWEVGHPRPRATIDDVADHIEHVREAAGIDHVGIGSDFDGISTTPVGLGDVSRFPYLFAELLDRGWSDEALAQLANGNILWVMREVEGTAARLREQRDPSTATLLEMSDGGRPTGDAD